MSEITDKYKLNEPIFTQAEIEARAVALGRRITEDFRGEEVMLVGILRGAVMWMSELLKNIDLETEIDFMAVSSYGSSTKSSGVVRIEKDFEGDIEGKNVILVEDIVDTGITLNYIRDYIGAKKPKTVRICALLDKPSRREVHVDIDYLGFRIDDIFVVGYGLDVAQRYRNLPYITSVRVDG